MGKLWSIRQVENLDKAFFNGVGKYEIPSLMPVELDEPIDMIGFNFAKRYPNPEDVGVHFFLKDYMFGRVWDMCDRYTEMLSRFRFVCTPDFSMYTDYPMALQICNHYKKHWIGAYWQSKGLVVVPTICWSDERSLEWCFDGEPVGSTVAVSSVGTQLNRRCKELFLLGFAMMLDRLEPTTILFHGDMPEDVGRMIKNDKNEIRVVKILAFQSRLRKIKGGNV